MCFCLGVASAVRVGVWPRSNLCGDLELLKECFVRDVKVLDIVLVHMKRYIQKEWQPLMHFLARWCSALRPRTLSTTSQR